MWVPWLFLFCCTACETSVVFVLSQRLRKKNEERTVALSDSQSWSGTYYSHPRTSPMASRWCQGLESIAPAWASLPSNNSVPWKRGHESSGGHQPLGFTNRTFCSLLGLTLVTFAYLLEQRIELEDIFVKEARWYFKWRSFESSQFKIFPSKYCAPKY